MTTVTLRIAVDKTGAVENIGQVKKGLTDMGTAGAQGGQQASQGVNSLRGALDSAKSAVASFVAAYAAIRTLSGVVRLADEYQGLSDRLRLVTDSTEEFSAAQQGVFNISQQTGNALSGVASLYTRLAQSTDTLNLSQGQLLTITEAVSQSFVVSGAGANEADAAIRQLSQGFASGVLRGDEFNSVMENSPRLARALADSLNVTVGELRAMAAEGKLTSEVLAQGLLQQAPAIAAEFDQMNLTVGRAFQQLSNSVLRFVGEASQSSGAAQGLARVISAVAENIDELARALGALATAVAVVIGARGVGALVGAFQSVATSIALTAAPMGAFIVGANGAAAATSAWAVAGRALFGLMGGWVGILATAAAGVYYLSTAQTEVEKTATAAEDAVLKLKTAQGDLRPVALSAAEAQLKVVDAMLETARAANESSRAVVAAMAANNSALEDNYFQSNLIIQSINEQADGLAALERSAASLRIEIGKAKGLDPIASLESIGILDDANVIMRAFGVSIGEVNRQIQGAIPPAIRLIPIIEDQGRTTRTTTAETRGLTSALQATTTAATRTQDAFGNTLDDTLGLARGLDTATSSTDEFSTAITESGGYAEDWGRYWEGAIGAVADSFGDFVASGLKSFKDFGNSLKQIAKRIISDLVSQFIQSRITIPITALLTGGPAGAANPLGSLFGGAGGAGGLLGGGAGGLLGPIALAGGVFGALGAAFGRNPVTTGIGGILGGPIGALIGALLGGGKDVPLLRVRSNEFSGPRRSEGQATSALGNIFVRTEDLGSNAPTSPEIAQRIADFDNLLAGFLNSTQLEQVRQRLANVNDTFRNGAATLEDALGSRFSAVLSAFNDDVQNFVGTSGTLEERVQRLADAMTITAIAADGAISSDFGEIAALLTNFREAGEGLGDTFVRISAGLNLVDGALAILNGTFNGTRLEAATFSAELIRISGGIDAFAQRLNGALEALFTDEERNQFLADQSRAALNQALSGLNISGVGIESIRQQLRDQLRSALEAGNSALVDQILTAANALGAFGSAIEALGEEAVTAANETVFGGTSSTLTAGGSLVSGAGTSTGTPATPATQLEASVIANRYLERQTGLLETIADNTRPTANPEAAKSARDTADASRTQVELLREIRDSIREQVRQEVQAGLKSLRRSKVAA